MKSKTPPFKPGDLVETDFVKLGERMKCRVVACKPSDNESGWIVHARVEPCPTCGRGDNRLPDELIDSAWFKLAKGTT